MSIADQKFIETVNKILMSDYSDLDQKVRPHWEDGTPAHTYKAFGVINEYDLRVEFPALTLRPTALKSAFDEILWIWQRKSNNIHDLKSHIWDQWADESGSIGTAYGYQLAKKYQFAQGEMDQVDNILWLLKNTPASRRIMAHLYNFADLKDMHLEPCCWSVTLNVTGNVLNMILNQRSQDTLVANNWNVCQYALLLMMFAQVSGLEAGRLIHVISDCHLYDRHVPLIEEMMKRSQFPAPKVWLNPDVKDFYAFKVEDLHVENYQTNPQIKNIPVAI